MEYLCEDLCTEIFNYMDENELTNVIYYLNKHLQKQVCIYLAKKYSGENILSNIYDKIFPEQLYVLLKIFKIRSETKDKKEKIKKVIEQFKKLHPNGLDYYNDSIFEFDEKWLENNNKITIYSPMGTGKTAMGLKLALECERPTIICCTVRCMSSWIEEAKKFGLIKRKVQDSKAIVMHYTARKDKKYMETYIRNINQKKEKFDFDKHKIFICVGLNHNLIYNPNEIKSLDNNIQNDIDNYNDFIKYYIRSFTEFNLIVDEAHLSQQSIPPISAYENIYMTASPLKNKSRKVYMKYYRYNNLSMMDYVIDARKIKYNPEDHNKIVEERVKDSKNLGGKYALLNSHFERIKIPDQNILENDNSNSNSEVDSRLEIYNDEPKLFDYVASNICNKNSRLSYKFTELYFILKTHVYNYIKNNQDKKLNKIVVFTDAAIRYITYANAALKTLEEGEFKGYKIFIFGNKCVTHIPKFKNTEKVIVICSYLTSIEGVNFSEADLGIFHNFCSNDLEKSRQCLGRFRRKNNTNDEINLLFYYESSINYILLRINEIFAKHSDNLEIKKKPREAIHYVLNILNKKHDITKLSNDELIFLFTRGKHKFSAEDILKFTIPVEELLRIVYEFSSD